jgi:hypothetical protein
LAYGLLQLTCSEDHLDSHVVGVADRFLHVPAVYDASQSAPLHTEVIKLVSSAVAERGWRSRCCSGAFQSMWMQWQRSVRGRNPASAHRAHLSWRFRGYQDTFFWRVFRSALFVSNACIAVRGDDEDVIWPLLCNLLVKLVVVFFTSSFCVCSGGCISSNDVITLAYGLWRHWHWPLLLHTWTQEVNRLYLSHTWV